VKKDFYNLEKEENLVKKTCRELGITQKELAEIIGISPTTIFRWNKQGIDKTAKIILDGLMYKQKFEDIKRILQIELKN
jgi:DNA-binding XRE family transcriptional regulator